MGWTIGDCDRCWAVRIQGSDRRDGCLWGGRWFSWEHLGRLWRSIQIECSKLRLLHLLTICSGSLLCCSASASKFASSAMWTPFPTWDTRGSHYLCIPKRSWRRPRRWISNLRVFVSAWGGLSLGLILILRLIFYSSLDGLRSVWFYRQLR